MPDQNPHQVATKPPIEPAFLDAAEAAQAIPLPLRTFHLYLKRGLIPSYRFGRYRLFRRDEVIAAVMQHRVAAINEVLE